MRGVLGRAPPMDTRTSSCTTRRRSAGTTFNRPTRHLRHLRCPSKADELNARAVAAWSATCIFIVLSTTNPVYKATVLAAAGGLRRVRGVLAGVTLIALFAVLLNFVSAHLGATVLFRLPDQIPAVGGPYTLEALAFGATGGLTVGAAIIAAAPFSLLLA